MAEERPLSTPVLGAIAGAVLVVAVAVVLLLQRTGTAPSTSGPVPGEEQKAYLSKIVVTDARLSAAENFLGHTVTYLDARVTNQGNKVVRRIELLLEFHDTLNQVVLRETARPVTRRTPPLRPNETRSFQVSFEHMPVDWNQAPPTITGTYVEF